MQFTVYHSICSIFGFRIYACVICWQEAPAVVQSFYSRRIVGCPGGEGGKFNNLPGWLVENYAQTGSYWINQRK